MSVKSSALSRSRILACQSRERDTLQRISEMTAKEKTLSGAEGSGDGHIIQPCTPVLSLGRSPLAPQGRMGSRSVRTKTLSFNIDTSQLSNSRKGRRSKQLRVLKHPGHRQLSSVQCQSFITQGKASLHSMLTQGEQQGTEGGMEIRKSQQCLGSMPPASSRNKNLAAGYC